MMGHACQPNTRPGLYKLNGSKDPLDPAASSHLNNCHTTLSIVLWSKYQEITIWEGREIMVKSDWTIAILVCCL
jgi:hypothetical protein